MSLCGYLMVQFSLKGFRKIPFACSYLPGKANLHLKIGLYAMGLLAAASFAVQIEYFALSHARRFAILCAILAALAAWAWRRWIEFARMPDNWLQFEDLPQADVEALDLHNPPPTPIYVSRAR